MLYMRLSLSLRFSLSHSVLRSAPSDGCIFQRKISDLVFPSSLRDSHAAEVGVVLRERPRRASRVAPLPVAVRGVVVLPELVWYRA